MKGASRAPTICKKIIEARGGMIGVVSEPNKG